jgi:hypothetical protein
MFKRLVMLFVCALLILPFTLSAYSWPTSTGLISVAFGQYRQGLVDKGLVFSSTTPLDINPIEAESKLIFSTNSQNNVMPTRSGAMISVHNSNSMRAIYSAMESVNHNLPTYLTTNLLLGSAKQEEGGYYFGFSLYDNTTNQFVNPLLFLQGRPLLNSPPIFRALYLSDEQGNLKPLVDGLNLASNRYEIVLDSATLLQNPAQALAPYSVQLELMGATLSRVQMDAIFSEGGVAYLQGNNPLPIKQMYTNQGYLRLGSVNFMPGQMIVSLTLNTLSNQRMNRITRRINVF